MATCIRPSSITIHLIAVMHRTGALFIIAAAILWGTLGIAGRVAFRTGVSPLEAAFYRAGISFVMLLLILRLTDRRDLKIQSSDLALFGGFGLVGVAVFFVLYLVAISTTSVATAAILLYTAPAFVIVLSALLLDEPLTKSKGAAIILAFAGCVLVVHGYDPTRLKLNLPGVLAGLGSGLTYALYSIFGKRALRQYRPLTTLTYALGFGTIFLGLAALAAGALKPSHSVGGWAAILYLAVVTTLLAQWLYLVGLRQVEAGEPA